MIREKGGPMGAFDAIKNAVNEHGDQINEGIDKAGDFVDEKTEGKYADKVDQAQDFLKDQVNKG